MNSLVGTSSLVRLMLRRERVRLTAWVVLLAVVIAGIAASFESLYPGAPSRMQFGASIANNPALLTLTGPAFDLSTIGGLTAWRSGSVSAVLGGLMAVFTLVRHTRADEEGGRLELISSTVVGRYAALTAALLVVFGAGLVLALLTGIGLLVQGLPVSGCFALGLGNAGVVWTFGAATALIAQLTESSRTATGAASAAVGAAFLLRAAGDSAGPTWLSWLSPIGWAQRLQPFTGERWWVLALPAGAALVLTGVAYAVLGGRDIGAGLIPIRLGPPAAGPALRGVFGLAWRLHRGALLGWVLAFAVLGGCVGAIVQGIADILKTNPQLERILAASGRGQGIVDSFLATVMGVLGLVAAAYAVQAALRMRNEETSQRVEPLLALAVSRTRLLVSHLAFSSAGAVVLLAVAGLVAGFAHGLRIGDVGGQVPRVLAAALAQAPAALVLAGVTAALVGVVPRVAVLAWAVLVGCALLSELGSVLRLDQWVLDVSPFTHVPKLPGVDFHAEPVWWLLVVAVALSAIGLVGFRRRDAG